MKDYSLPELFININDWRPLNNRWFARKLTNNLKNNVPNQQLHNRGSAGNTNKNKQA